MTPLLYAMVKGQAAVVRLLLERGADLAAADDEHRARPLGWAAFYGQTEIARMLLEAGAKIGHSNTYGHTALKCAQLGVEGQWREHADATTEDYQAVIDLLRERGGGE